MTEVERVQSILEAKDQGESTGRRLVYNPATRTLCPADSNACPPGAMVFDSEDFKLAGRGACEMVITLSGELVEQRHRTGVAHDLGFLCWDDGDAYTCLHGDGPSGAVPGTLLFSDELKAVDTFGKPADQVRIVVTSEVPQAAADGGADQRRFARGYVRREGAWHEAKLQITPLRQELFSRSHGLLETDVLAAKRVFVAGLGSVGSTVAFELAKCGVNLDLMDHDRLEVCNASRHLAGLSQAGRRKTRIMADLVLDKNPYARVRTFDVSVDRDSDELVRQCVQEADVVISATGDRASNLILNGLCIEYNRLLIIGAAFRRAHGGQVLRVRPRVGPCYQCFLMGMPGAAADREIASARQAAGLAYTDRVVPIEPGLSNDIAPISQMMVKLSIQELLAGTETTLLSLNDDLVAPWYLFLKRRENDTSYAQLKPMRFDVGQMSILRWYGIDLPRQGACPVCGNFVGHVSKSLGTEISKEDANAFATASA